MAKDKRKKYIASWEPEYWQYSPDGKGVTCPASVRQRTFLWKTKIVAGPFKDLKEAGDYVYDVLGGKLSKKQSKQIYGKVR